MFMFFNSIEFMIFFAIIVILYYALPSRFQNKILLIANFFFYAFFSIKLVLYLFVCTMGTYFIGTKIQKAKGNKGKSVGKMWMVVGVIIDAGALCICKYLNFGLNILEVILNKIGMELSFPRIDILVPLGISFITFQTISYMVDIYKDRISSKNLFEYVLYVSFFPNIVQGPIMKANNMIPQFEYIHTFNLYNFKKGFLEVLYGLFLKMVLADRLALVVNIVYASPGEYSGASILLATIAFALQIYFDFAGYSLISIGVARILGFDLIDNFRQPYLSSSVGEFWRRWHISLNIWLRDYIYIPMGGSRCTALRTSINVLVTFGISGLWHGANFGYIIWGLLNGIYVVIEKHIKKLGNIDRFNIVEKKSGFSIVRKIIGCIVTFILICFSWIFFRAQRLSVSIVAIKNLFCNFRWNEFIIWANNCIISEEGVFLGLSVYSWKYLIKMLIVAFIVDLILQKINLSEKIAKGNMMVRWIIYLILMFTVIIGGMYGYGYEASSFIYTGF